VHAVVLVTLVLRVLGVTVCTGGAGHEVLRVALIAAFDAGIRRRDAGVAGRLVIRECGSIRAGGAELVVG